jgi:hypothetical protein
MKIFRRNQATGEDICSCLAWCPTNVLRDPFLADRTAAHKLLGIGQPQP